MFSGYRGEYCRLQLDRSCEKILDQAQSAYINGLKVILDGLPLRMISKAVLKYITLATLNEQQVGNLTKTEVNSLETAKTAALKLYGRGVDTVIITMGVKGVLVFSEEVFTVVNAPLSLKFDAVVVGNVFNTVLPLTLNTQTPVLYAVKSAYQTAINIVLFLN